MNSKQRTWLLAALGFFAVTSAVFLGSKADADLPREQIVREEWGAVEEYARARGMMRAHAAKVALGNNANAVLSLDLIANGGAGNRRDDGVTSGTVSGRGATIAIEVFATGVATSLRGAVLRFRFDATLVSFVKAENSAFGLSVPEGSVGVNLASTSSVTLGASGFLARAEFRTVADVTGREFSIGVERVTIAESVTSSDDLTTTSVIRFNATPSADFDGDGTVGFSDFLAFAGSFGASRGDARYEARFDLNGDGSVGFSDFLVFAGAFGSQVPPSGGGTGTDTQPSFAAGSGLGNQTYTVGAAISALTLPEASGGNSPLTYSLSPAVPGLTFNATTRRLTGTPTAAGTYDMTYRVRDNDGDTDSLTFAITVRTAKQADYQITVTDVRFDRAEESSGSDYWRYWVRVTATNTGARPFDFDGVWPHLIVQLYDKAGNPVGAVSQGIFGASPATAIWNTGEERTSSGFQSVDSDRRATIAYYELDSPDVPCIGCDGRWTDVPGGGSGSPDLIVESPSVDDNTLTTGQSFTLSATVRNQGNASAAAATLRYYRSSNATISDSDTEVGTDGVGGLSAGATSAESISLNAPSDAGTYYYGACVDNVNGESDTDNNCSSGVSVTVSGGNTGGGNNLGACAVGMVVKPNQRCSVGRAEFINIGGGCYQFTAFGTGRFCSSGFNLNGLTGTRVGNDYRITAVP